MSRADKLKLRTVGEILAIASVVAGLLLVTYEIRQANRIARAQAVMELAGSYNQLSLAQATDTDFARLRLVMEDPVSFQITDVEKAKIQAVAFHLHNTAWSAQTAYDSGLLSRDELDTYRNELRLVTTQMPGLNPYLVEIFEAQPWKREAYVFAPLAELAMEMGGNSPNAE